MPDAVAPEFIALQQAVIGRYSLERELGRGGMGIVFLARDVALDRPVAIKLLPPGMATQPSLRERFLREARLAAKLSHPNIIPIFGVEQIGDLVFFAMAYVEGDTLGQRLRAKGPLHAREATKLLQEVAWALAYAHLRGIVHRDVKPDNILLEASTGRALVSDFGIARATETSGATAVGEVLGTAQYMSPEQACGETVDGRSDLYSLGIVGFLALSGRLPFDAPDIAALLAQQITKPAPPLASVQPGVPKNLAAAVDRCLEKDPARRFQTGEQLAEALAQETAVAREVPAPVRVWLTRGTGATAILTGWTILMGLGTASDIVNALHGVHEQLTGNFLALAIPWLVYGLYRGLQTQRLVSAGYRYEDLAAALRQHVERRREELTFEYDRTPTALGRGIRYLSYTGLATAAGWTVYAALAPAPSLSSAWIAGAGATVAVFGTLLGMMIPGRRVRARDWLLEWRSKLMNTRFGKALFKIESLGARPGAVPASVHRPTEVAIGLASQALFEALPKETRKHLKDLPVVIRRLEADAAATRARVDELSAMLAGTDGTATTPSASLQLDGGAAASQLARHQAQLTADLTAQRDAAAHRLAASVAALENLRLDLLRLKAGVGTVDELSADLSAARDIEKEIDVAIASNEEVRALLEE